MEKELTILIVAPCCELPDLEHTGLAGRRVRLLSASLATNIESLCRRHGVGLIITGLSENDGSKFFHRDDLPLDIPILCLGLSNAAAHAFPGIVSCFQESLSTSNLHDQLIFLLQIKDRHNDIRQKDAEIKALTDKLEQQQRSMELHSEFLDIVALRDGLTGLYNRRQLNALLPKKFERCCVNDSELSMLILNIDYFYELNKSAGTSFCDFVLNDFAARLTAANQAGDTCFRFSGETFIVLLGDTTLSEAISRAEFLQQNLRHHPFKRSNEQRTITVSIGIVSLIDHQPESPESFVSMAERALFSAKADGRDRIAVFSGKDRGGNETTRHNLNFLKETLSRILARTRTSSLDSLQLLAMDIGGNNNRGHIENVRRYVELLGQHMNLPESTIETFRNAVALHTSIRFLLHNEMISKQGLFTEDDREIMSDFPFKLAEITEMFDYFSNERAILLYHGERFDGSGYPDGLIGDEIPLGARIFALVDALAAMNEDRPHRSRLEPDQVLTELVDGAGRQFDPTLVIQMLELIKANHLMKLSVERIDSSINTITESIESQTP